MGFYYALIAAVLYGAGTPVSKILLGKVSPYTLAALYYLGSSLGLTVYIIFKKIKSVIIHRKIRNPHSPPPTPHSKEASISKEDLPWLAGTILAGGVLSPILLFMGLNLSRASYASMLLNFEVVLTAMMASFFFREAAGKKLWTSVGLITLAAFVLSWDSSALKPSLEPGMIFIVLCCIMLAVDNNLTRQISAKDPIMLTIVKGWAAGIINLALAVSSGASCPGIYTVSGGLLAGLFGYGVSLAFFILAMRELGAARATTVLGVYPFVGAALSVFILNETPTPQLLFSSLIMAAGIWVLSSEKHEHRHSHKNLEHEHLHSHDEHHDHPHEAGAESPHSHRHTHAEIEHSHPHTPDIHHRHSH